MDIYERLQKLIGHHVFAILRYGADNNPYYDAHGILQEIGDGYVLLHIPDVDEGNPDDKREITAADLIVNMEHLITILHHSDCPLCNHA